MGYAAAKQARYRARLRARDEDPAAPLVRAVLATCLAALKRPNIPGQVARSMWPEDRDIDLVLRAAVGSATLANTPALAQIAQAFLTTLIPVSAGADLMDRGIGLSFGGAAQVS